MFLSGELPARLLKEAFRHFSCQLLCFLDDAIDGGAVHALDLLSVQLKYFLKPFHVGFGLAQMRLEPLLVLRNHLVSPANPGAAALSRRTPPLGSGKGPGRRLSPRRGPRCPTSTFGGSRSGAMVKQPLEHSSSSARQSIRVLRGELPVKDPSDEGPQACFAKPNIGVALLRATKGRKH